MDKSGYPVKSMVMLTNYEWAAEYRRALDGLDIGYSVETVSQIVHIVKTQVDGFYYDKRVSLWLEKGSIILLDACLTITITSPCSLQIKKEVPVWNIVTILSNEGMFCMGICSCEEAARVLLSAGAVACFIKDETTKDFQGNLFRTRIKEFTSPPSQNQDFKLPIWSV